MKEEYKGTTKLYSRCTEVEAVVLANGEYPTASLPLHILESAPYVVCCDGGADEYIRQGHIPNLIIGDGDSICEENRRKYGHLLHCISEQETNDQTKAVSYLLSQGKRRIAIVGATGRREDHTLGNISLLMDYMRAGADVCTYTDYGVFIPCRDTCTSPAGRGSRYLSSTSAPAGCMESDWYIPSATSPTGGKALSTNVPAQSLQSKLKENTYCS